MNLPAGRAARPRRCYVHDISQIAFPFRPQCRWLPPAVQYGTKSGTALARYLLDVRRRILQNALQQAVTRGAITMNAVVSQRECYTESAEKPCDLGVRTIDTQGSDGSVNRGRPYLQQDKHTGKAGLHQPASAEVVAALIRGKVGSSGVDRGTGPDRPLEGCRQVPVNRERVPLPQFPAQGVRLRNGHRRAVQRLGRHKGSGNMAQTKRAERELPARLLTASTRRLHLWNTSSPGFRCLRHSHKA